MIIQIQPSDELNTIIHQLQQTPDEQITLTASEEMVLLRDPLFWQVIADYSERLGKHITLDSRDPAACRLAHQSGLTVTEEHLLAAADEETQGPAHKKSRRVVERLSVILLIAAACLGIIYLTLPKVTLVVTPAVESFTHVLNFPLGSLAAAELVEKQISLTRSTSATGRQTVGVAKAVGEIVLINQSEQSIIVPQGTIVTTASGTPFQTTADVEVPGLSTQYFMGIPVGLQAGQAVAAIEALTPGSIGNVAEGRVEKIVGFDLTVRNPEPTRGGADTVLQVAVSDDLMRARQIVERDAELLLAAQIEEELIDSFRLFLADTLRVELDWGNETTPGEETAEVFTTAVARGRAYILDENQLMSEVRAALNHMQPKGYSVIGSSVQISELESFAVDGNEILRLTVSGQSQAEIVPEEIIGYLLGAAVAHLEELAEEIPAIAGLEVKDYDGDYLPKRPRWLHVEVNSIRQ